MKASNIYDSVTDAIIAELKQGAAPWVKPWRNGRTAGLMPVNVATGRSYSGINIPILWHAAEINAFPTHGWMTFRQALAEGGSVRKGERGTHVVFARRITRTEDEEERSFALLRGFVVFNAAQIDGIAEKPPSPGEACPPDRFVAATGAAIRHGGNEACYLPDRDLVCLPEPWQFHETESYHATTLHELGHWTGHRSRLDRDLAHRFGSRAYAAEELIAELTAAFLCAHLGIRGELRHAGYIQDWIRLLSDDRRAIFTAASKASQAASYLRRFSEVVEEDHADG